MHFWFLSTFYYFNKRHLNVEKARLITRLNSEPENG